MVVSEMETFPKELRVAEGWVWRRYKLKPAMYPCPVLSSPFPSHPASYDVANSTVSEEAENAELLLVRKQ